MEAFGPSKQQVILPPGMQTPESIQHAADQETAVHAGALPKADRARGGSCREANSGDHLSGTLCKTLPMVAIVGERVQGKAHQSNA